jgi:hypothetical protein
LKENVEETTKNLGRFQIIEIDQIDQLEQRNVVLFLRLKGLSKKAIQHTLVAVLQENAISQSLGSYQVKATRVAFLEHTVFNAC